MLRLNPPAVLAVVVIVVDAPVAGSSLEFV
jgi:hypothetical protein